MNFPTDNMLSGFKTYCAFQLPPHQLQVAGLAPKGTNCKLIAFHLIELGIFVFPLRRVRPISWKHLARNSFLSLLTVS